MFPVRVWALLGFLLGYSRANNTFTAAPARVPTVDALVLSRAVDIFAAQSLLAQAVLSVSRWSL